MAKKTTKKQRGAKRVADKKPKRKIGRYVLLCLLVVPLLFQLSIAVSKMDIAPSIKVPSFELVELGLPELSFEREKEITNVIVQGEFQYSNQAQLQNDIAKMIQEGFVKLNLTDIQSVLLENYWYRNVSVQRVWPASLKVHIEEELPIARWGDKAFLNRYGEIINVGDISMLDHLPLLQGQDERAYEVAKRYSTVGQLLGRHELFITKLSVSEDSRWTMEVNHDFTVDLGSRNVSDRIERFLFLYEQQLAPLVNEFAHIDMRYQSGVAVEWKENTLAAVSARKELVSR